MQATQNPLIPTEAPRLAPVTVPLSDLPVPVHPPLAPDFINSILNYGIMQPPVIAMTRDGWRILDGRRRVAALQWHAMMQEDDAVDINVDCYGLIGDASPAALSLLLNEQRSANPVSDLAAIEELIAAGRTENEISQATGLSKQTIRQRLRLATLLPPLRKAFDAGKIAPSVAYAAARQPEKAQRDLAHTHEQHGKLTLRDVEENRRVVSSLAASALPASLFTSTPEEIAAATPVPAPATRDARLAMRDARTVLNKAWGFISKEHGDCDLAAEILHAIHDLTDALGEGNSELIDA